MKSIVKNIFSIAFALLIVVCLFQFITAKNFDMFQYGFLAVTLCASTSLFLVFNRKAV